MSKRARKTLKEIGGVMPDGLPEIPPELTSEVSGLLAVENIVDVNAENSPKAQGDGFDISIADIPYVDDANVIIEDSQIDIIPVAEEEEHEKMPEAPPPAAKPPALPRQSLLPKEKKNSGPVKAPPSKLGMAVTESTDKPPQRPKPNSIAPAPPDQALSSKTEPKKSSSELKFSDVTRPVPQLTLTGEPVISRAKESTATAASAAAGAEAPDIEEDLEEIEFFLEQGLVEEARAIYDDLFQTYPEDPRLLQLSESFKQAVDISQRDGVSVELDIAEQTGKLNIEELSSDLNLEEVQGEVAVDTVFNKFKEGVKKQISKSDFDTHFDLGQAYKEMGLWDDAIGEFKIAADDPERAGTAELMVGMCHLGAGRFEDAIETFDAARRLPGQGESEKLALLYEKAKVLELMEQYTEAKSIYQKILDTDPTFADVSDRLNSLEQL